MKETYQLTDRDLIALKVASDYENKNLVEYSFIIAEYIS